MSILIDRQDGLSSAAAIKGPVRVASTANIVSLAGLQTIDGVALAEDDRVLVKDQTDESENGLYVVDTGNWRRSKDFSRTDDVVKGTSVMVVEGTLNAGLMYYVTTSGDIIFGSSDIEFRSSNGSIAQVAKTPDNTGLKQLDTTFFNEVVVSDNGFRWSWETGDFTDEIAADTDENTYIKADGVDVDDGAWVRISPETPPVIAERIIRFSQFRARYGSDQLAFEAMLTKAFTTSDNAIGVTIDLEGCVVVLTSPIDVSAVTGKITNFKNITLRNGTLDADETSGNWVSTVIGRSCDIVQFSQTVTITSSTGLEAGMCVKDSGSTAITLGDGIPRETYVTGVTDSTHFTISTYAYRDRTKFYSIEKFPYMLNFKGFETLSRMKFVDLNVRCNSVASFVMLAQEGIDLCFSNIHALAVKDRFITDWSGNLSGAEIINCTAWSSDATESHTGIGITANDNDVKFLNNRIINFRHSQVCHGGGYTISGCHNWQGNGAAVRTGAFIFTNPSPFLTMTGNYIDNGGIEITNENQSSGGNAFNDITITGNAFTMASSALGGSRYITLGIVGYGTDTAVRGIEGMSVCNNVFRRLVGGGAETIDNVDAVEVHGTGGLDNDAINDFVWTGNTYRNITYHVSNPNKFKRNYAGGAETTSYGINFDNRLPFGLQPRSLEAVSLFNMRNAASVLQSPTYAVIRGGTGYTFTFTTAMSGTVYATVSANQND